MEFSVDIRRYSQDEVYGAMGSLFNVNNKWADDKVARPDNYYEILDKSRTKNWVSPDVKYIELDKEDTRWMLEAASKVGVITGKFSHIYDHELENTLAKHAHKFPTGNWFIRVERVSLKNGMHGIGPYSNLKMVIESIVSSNLGHECICDRDNLENFRIYFLPWKNISQEFRVFVYQNQITAISTQHYSEINYWLANQTVEELKNNVVLKINSYFETHLRDKLKDIVGPNYTMDIALLDDNSVYFIEPNSFGANYAAGSALFNWTIDHDILHNPNSIELRFVDRD